VRKILQIQGLHVLPGSRKTIRGKATMATADLVERQFARPAPDQLWVTDITEHPTREGTLYCCVVLEHQRTGQPGGGHPGPYANGEAYAGGMVATLSRTASSPPAAPEFGRPRGSRARVQQRGGQQPDGDSEGEGHGPHRHGPVLGSLSTSAFSVFQDNRERWTLRLASDDRRYTPSLRHLRSRMAWENAG
jgi:hypothetical protein